MPLAAGDKLGPYEILAPLGAGGMGEVYKARDTRLGRDVAVKISNEKFSERFETEARAIASLNHPNICHLYDVGPDYLVMELIDGVRIKGPLPVEQALEIARQIADALETAHEKGVVHRDLKPANIMITSGGDVKVLDFGLAKVGDSAAAQTEDSPTCTMATQVGMIIGTAAYMSPEQAAGKTADKRSDIWSFGVILSEMLTGRRLFDGETVAHVVADVLRGPIDLSALPPDTPPAIRNLLERCLDRDPKMRLRDIGEARIVLNGPLMSAPQGVPASTTSRLRWIAAITLLIAAAGLAFINLRGRQPELPITRLSIHAPPKTRFYLGAQGALSPDGRRLAFVVTGADGNRQLWVRSLDSLTAQPLPGTENALYPFWSPDSLYIAFLGGHKLRKIDPSGGPATVVCDADNGRGGSWNQDGVILFSERGQPLQSIPSAGGVAHPVTVFDPARRERAHRWPWFLPDGKHFLYLAGSDGFGPTSGTIRAGSLNGGESRIVLEKASNVAYADGRLIFVRGSTLMAQPFDPSRLALTGEPVPVADNVQVGLLADAFFSVSQNGFLTYRTGGADTNELTWFDRSGKKLATAGESGIFGVLHLSPDGKQAATSVTDLAHENSDIWLYDLVRGVRTRFTSDPATESDPIWSPDGSTVVFSSSRRGGRRDLYRKSASGLQPEELLFADDRDKVPKSWSPDGKYLLFDTLNSPDNEIWLLPDPGGPLGDRKPVRLTSIAGNKQNGQFSPDGHWVAYNSNGSGRLEVYVVPFLGTGGLKQISTRGGAQPRWRRDGEELFYVASDNNLMAVEVSLHAGSIEVGAPRLLFGPLILGGGFMYDVSPDGQRILAVTETNQDSDEPITIVQNWPGLLKK